MEHKIGEIFEYNGEWYQCVIGYSCNDCAFNNDSCEERERITLKNQLTKEQITGLCSSKLRSDKKPVIFKKLEKVGEPYERYIGSNKSIKVQRYKLPYRYAILPKEPFMILEPNYKNSIEIGIKHFKEDLEEKNESAEEISIRIANEFEEKLEKHFKEYMDKIGTSNLKPFDIQKAKEGKPVCTRNGRKARIICFDRICGDDYYKIVACVTAFDGDFEEVLSYGIDGYIVDSQNPKDEDLMMLPEKKEGWILLRKDGCVFDNEEVAKKNCTDDYFVAKVEWEDKE